ncbi:hypothetical protein VIGAN_04121000 [Vigna angularis var. angularis]|uniref:Uncharacterized protein n=1 Tax=Vigna angularis var. angularis TaxID=157739 RepID=A0A0S3RTR0_PHAAN|nr:hypothetical protein VIGAN_04121000 [Vigna angularis var. angularis]
MTEAHNGPSNEVPQTSSFTFKAHHRQVTTTPSSRRDSNLVNKHLRTAPSEQFNGKNEYLSTELDNCRVNLHDIFSKNAELRNQFNAAMAEVEAFSARVVELQNNFDMSQKDSLELSKELVDCKGLISSLQVEKKGMNEILDLRNNEKSKLLEEKEFHLFEIKNLVS